MTPKLNGHDRELLEFVANAQRVTHRQLLEVALIKKVEKDRKTFEWRVARLAESGLLKKERPEFLNRTILYTITRMGILALENLGVHMLSLYVAPDESNVKHQIPHSLELNRINIALMKSGALFAWTPAHAVRVLYRFDKSSYAKVYDAVTTLVIDNEVYTVGVEYERSLKPAEKYVKILSQLSNQDQVDAVVYLCPNHMVLRSIRQVFGSFVKKPVLVADHELFIADVLDAPLDWCYRETTLRLALPQLCQRNGYK